MEKLEIDERYQTKIWAVGYLMNTEENTTDKLVTQIGHNANYLSVLF